MSKICINSGTYPTIIERIAGDDDHIKCSQCGRLLKLRRYRDYVIIPWHAAMMLIKISNREYETPNKRFNALWSDKRKGGARSCYRVLDRETGRCLRAFNLAEVRETIADMANTPGQPPPDTRR